MKKFKYLVISLICLFAFNINSFAASGSLGVSSSSVYVGDSFTVSANISSAAAWNVHVSASGPVSGCSINQADATADAMDTNKTFSATCTATGTGTITIILSGDVTSASDGNAVNISGSRNVTVTTRPVQPNNNNPVIDNRSRNNNIKELSVEGYDLTKVDNHNYTLSVPNDVTSVNIKATAEDSKAKVTGAGNHNLNVGENKIEIIVIAENGSQNKITITVTRKDGYYLEDLDTVLKNNKIDDINITIKSDTKVTAKDLDKIKKSGKTVKFNYYNDDKNLVYSWIINGSKIDSTNDLLTTISSNPESKKDILVLSNYADGIFVGLNQMNSLPSGTKLKLFVGNKYGSNDLVNVYVKSADKLELVTDKLKVENGYVEFDVKDSSDYFITMSTISTLSTNVTNTNKSSSSLMIVVIILSFLVIGLFIALIFNNKKNKKSVENKNNNVNDEVTQKTEIVNNELNKVEAVNTINYSSYNTNGQT